MSDRFLILSVIELATHDSAVTLDDAVKLAQDELSKDSPEYIVYAPVKRIVLRASVEEIEPPKRAYKRRARTESPPAPAEGDSPAPSDAAAANGGAGDVGEMPDFLRR